jgi:enamine deaminase RidA (YjgF/YER057c/UK114 family)
MRGAVAFAALLALSSPSAAQDGASGGVVRHPIPGSEFPISRAVELPAGRATVYVSGAVPQRGADGWGDTEAQTVSVLNSIEDTLADLDLTPGDVVKMTVFLVAPDGEAMDFAGFMAGYTQYFGTETQPALPARSVVEVAGLANPDWLVEIEVIAAR